MSTSAFIDIREVEQFVYLEARLQDEHRYTEWEALWTDDALYWVPAGADDIDPERQVSFIYDNRQRIASRIRQLNTGARPSQIPPSRMRRTISNIEIGTVADWVGDIRVESNFMLAQSRAGLMNLWAGRTLHRIRPAEGGFRLVTKKVMLVNNDQPIPNLGFLI